MANLVSPITIQKKVDSYF